MLSFFRVIRFAFQDIIRNLSLSIMTVLILILMLLSLNTLLVIRVLTQAAITAVESQIDLSIFFIPSATDKQIADVRAHVTSFPEVSATEYLDRDQVLAAFKNQHQDSADILASLQELGDNPLGPTLVVKSPDPKNYEKIIASLNVPEYNQIITAKTFADTEKAIERINTITSNVERLSLAFTFFFAVISLIIIFNTIRVAIYTERLEITIKKLVGASNWFVRGPYIIEAMIFSLIATALAFAFVLLATNLLDPYMAVIFQTSPFLTEYFKSHILLLLPAELGGVLLLTIGTSLIAMRRYLRA